MIVLCDRVVSERSGKFQRNEMGQNESKPEEVQRNQSKLEWVQRNQSKLEWVQRNQSKLEWVQENESNLKRVQRNEGKEVQQNVADAARKMDWKEVRRLVEQGGSVNDVDRWSRRTALHWSAQHGNSDICLLLLSRGAIVSQTDKNGDTPLHLPAYDHRVNICQLLVDHKANVTSVNKKGQTPLHRALVSLNLGDFPAVHHLLITNDSLNVADHDSNCALHIAVRKGDIKAVQLLVDCGADVNVLDGYGQTPLHTAAAGWEGCLELCSILLKHDAKIDVVDKDGYQPLHLACKRGRRDTSDLLLSSGAKVNAPNKDGRTPLHTAAGGEEDCPELCSILLKHDAKIDVVDKDGYQPLHLACKRGRRDTSDLLLSSGAKVNAPNKDGRTPLHTAAGGEEDCPELCSILLKHDAKIDVVDKDGNQPLHLACKQRNAATAHLLVSHGADVTVLNKEDREWIQLLTESISKSGQGQNGKFIVVGWHVCLKAGSQYLRIIRWHHQGNITNENVSL